MTTTYKDYKEILIETVDKLTRHSDLGKCQTQYLKSKKESLGKNEGLVLGDFSENYQFPIPHEIHSQEYWSKEYCTFHPSVIYYHNGECDLQLSLCFISDDNTHGTSFVYQIQTMMIDYLKRNTPAYQKFISQMVMGHSTKNIKTL